MVYGASSRRLLGCCRSLPPGRRPTSRPHPRRARRDVFREYRRHTVRGQFDCCRGVGWHRPLGPGRDIVTGAASGIGVETARALARAGAEVTLAVRDLQVGQRVAREIAITTSRTATNLRSSRKIVDGLHGAATTRSTRLPRDACGTSRTSERSGDIPAPWRRRPASPRLVTSNRGVGDSP